MRIIASLTTTPSRINLIQLALHSILNQTINIDSIELNIPFEFKRTGEKYEIPTWLKRLEESSKNTSREIRVYRTEDYGAITKVAPTLLRYINDKNAYIWSVDDDFYYPPNMLAVLFREHKPSIKRVLSHSRGFWTYNENKNCTGYKSNRGEGPSDFVEGFGTILYPPSSIEDDFENYLIQTSKIPDNRNSDDIIISNYLKAKNIELYNCGYPYQIAGALIDNDGLSYGQENDALHFQAGGNIQRYIRVFNWLKTHNINSWIKP